ncbi:hypothetical protein HYH02_007523 [Chlamydomonas schloesseri]|uniref:Rhodanese domain-containing protein n=1 Tax=Chlamydomonas schloesseri TaxID=2026947 RepID=A0A835WI60_9CHLO|nr:hypothetical protein HYH02_007523 [Chlamydomonas schloesseri]|eukprot:KAG2447601.1 hypothetical protein HYH02_007523 [Chlamydomonas schloesseri]
MGREPPVNKDAKAAAAADPAAKLEELYRGFAHRFEGVPEVTAQEVYAWITSSQQVAATDPQQGSILSGSEQQQAGPLSSSSSPPPPPPPAVVLVDVRSHAEQQVSVLPGSTTLTQKQFEARGPETFHGVRVVCYCTAGYRSGMYAAKLRRCHSHLQVYNMRGSILAWTQAGLPLADPRDGSHTKRVHVFSEGWALQGDGYEPVVFRRPLVSLALDSVGAAAQGLLRAVTGGGGRHRHAAAAGAQAQAQQPQQPQQPQQGHQQEPSGKQLGVDS